MRKIWTNKEVEFIKLNLSSMSLKDMAKELNVDYNKLVDKTHKLGLNSKKAKGEFWKESEDELLKLHFEYAPKDYLLNLFPNRTWNSIFQRGNKTLNLQRLSQDRISVDYTFFKEWNEKTAYIFGFILADGHLHYGDKNYLQFELAEYDKDILFKIKDELSYKGSVLTTKRNTCKLQINNKLLIADLIKKGIPKEQKTYSACFPESLPKHLYRHFIRGYFDGDGTIGFYNNRLYFQLLGTEKLLEEIKNILPINADNISIYDRNKQNANVFCLQIKNSHTLKIFDWLYKDATIYLDRKYNKYLEFKNSPYLEKSK